MFKRLIVTLLLLAVFNTAQANGVSSIITSTILASSAQTATYTSADQTNTSWAGVTLYVNTSAFTSGTFTPKIQGKDPISGIYYDIIVGTAISATGLSVLKIYPGITATANSSVSDYLPAVWRVVVTGATTPVATFSISALLNP